MTRRFPWTMLLLAVAVFLSAGPPPPALEPVTYCFDAAAPTTFRVEDVSVLACLPAGSPTGAGSTSIYPRAREAA